MVVRFLALSCITTLCRSSPKGMPCLRASLWSRTCSWMFGLDMSALIAVFNALSIFKNKERTVEEVSALSVPLIYSIMISRCIIIYEEHLLILGYRRRFNSRVRWSAFCWCHSSWAVRCTRPFIGETARHSLHSYMVTFFTRCPDTWRYVARILGSMILHLTSATDGNGSLARLVFSIILKSLTS